MFLIRLRGRINRLDSHDSISLQFSVDDVASTGVSGACSSGHGSKLVSERSWLSRLSSCGCSTSWIRDLVEKHGWSCGHYDVAQSEQAWQTEVPKRHTTEGFRHVHRLCKNLWSEKGGTHLWSEVGRHGFVFALRKTAEFEGLCYMRFSNILQQELSESSLVRPQKSLSSNQNF